MNYKLRRHLDLRRVEKNYLDRKIKNMMMFERSISLNMGGIYISASLDGLISDIYANNMSMLVIKQLNRKWKYKKDDTINENKKNGGMFKDIVWKRSNAND